jgi:hypothetical protein
MGSRKCLSETRVACSGLSDEERIEVVNLVTQLGGEMLTAIHMHDLPHIFIAASVRTEKYKVKHHTSVGLRALASANIIIKRVKHHPT